LARRGDIGTAPVSAKPLLALLDDAIPELVDELIGLYLETAQLLGQRTGEMHVALAQDPDSPNFAPEPFTDFYRQSIYQSMLGQATHTLQLLRQRLRYLPDTEQEEAQQLLSRQTEIRRRFQGLRDRRITAMRLRCHGDYHLGQVLYTGKDFVIIDFEGEPARSLSVRRMKRSPLRDVAGMLRSFHYAAFAALLDQTASVRPEDLPLLEPWARFWYQWVSVAYLKTYLAVTAEASFLPETREELRLLMDVYLLEKALYELGYELNSRPTWVKVPLQGILQLLETAG
jgi:maltose alpha-D-glucosyltransferase/alpha-amylase